MFYNCTKPALFSLEMLRQITLDKSESHWTNQTLLFSRSNCHEQQGHMITYVLNSAGIYTRLHPTELHPPYQIKGKRKGKEEDQSTRKPSNNR